MSLPRRFAGAVIATFTVAALSSAAPTSAQTAAKPAPAAPATEVTDLTGLAGVVEGSGSSFADRFYKAAIGSARSANGNLSVDYRAIGSGRGKAEFGNGITDFAGTDSEVKPDEAPRPGEFVYVPTTAGAVAVAYHLKGVETLRLSAPTIAKIFQRDVTRWNDPVIAAENPGVALPNRPIGVVTRADRSGTTSNFTKFLQQSASGVWRLGSGDAVNWPSTVTRGDGNRGVAQILSNNNGTIGYANLAEVRAVRLRTVKVRNRAGVYVGPTASSVTAAVSEATFSDDLTVETLNAEGTSSYPLTIPTFVLVRTVYPDRVTADLVKGFVRYLLNEGQDIAVRVDYARLPEPIRLRALAQLDRITAP